MPRPLTPALTDTLRHLTEGSGKPQVLSSALTGEPLGTADTCRATDILDALDRAHRQHHRWAATPYSARRSVLRGFLRLVHAHRDILTPLAQHACALSTRDAVADLGSAPRPRTATAWSGGPPHPASLRHRSSPAPFAPVLSSSTDDARPFTSLLRPVLPALAAGSCVLTQVTEHTAVITAYVMALARRAGLPAAAWQPLLGEHRATYAMLTEHADAHLLGCCPERYGPAAPRSTATAPALMAVRHDTRLPSALRAALHSCFGTAGRLCTSTPLVLVHERHHDLFAKAFTNAVARVPSRSPLASEAVLSSLLDEGQAQALRSYIRAAHSSGATVLHDGGHRPDLAPGLHGPVVLSHPRTWTLDPETLPPGPLAVIVPFSSWAEVLHLARRTGRHLNVHTRTPVAQLLPQFATLPADDIRLNPAHRRPTPGALRSRF
ncbi:aldehyde dehydrogenase family protein [Streptomyces sp. CA-132043]|uniref:aldehyde dehydrogenase family protein n=1 Tax=Streptomyces sp. CA-132043 TaxID=3240048 RepID=UPI003D8A0D98